MRIKDGFRPYVDVLHRLVLPARGGKRANSQRRNLVIAAQHQEKVSRTRDGCPHPHCKWCRIKVTLRKGNRR